MNDDAPERNVIHTPAGPVGVGDYVLVVFNGDTRRQLVEVDGWAPDGGKAGRPTLNVNTRDGLKSCHPDQVCATRPAPKDIVAAVQGHLVGWRVWRNGRPTWYSEAIGFFATPGPDGETVTPAVKLRLGRIGPYSTGRELIAACRAAADRVDDARQRDI